MTKSSQCKECLLSILNRGLVTIFKYTRTNTHLFFSSKIMVTLLLRNVILKDFIKKWQIQSTICDYVFYSLRFSISQSWQCCFEEWYPQFHTHFITIGNNYLTNQNNLLRIKITFLSISVLRETTELKTRTRPSHCHLIKLNRFS